MKQLIFCNGRVVDRSPIKFGEVPVGSRFGVLSAPMGPADALYDDDPEGLKQGEQYGYRVVLEGFVRTQTGAQKDFEGGSEESIDADTDVVILG